MVVFAHGYGCDQNVWQPVVDALPGCRRVLFDWPGAGRSDPGAYHPERHARLDGYAEDLLALLDALDLHDVTLVGHSVAASIALLAAAADDRRLGRLVLVAPSPCFLDDPPGYFGGFERAQLDDLVDGLARAHQAWSRAMAPVIMGTPDRPALAADLASRFCAMDPDIALRWARATFFADVRGVVPQVRRPCTVLQCTDDALAPAAVGEWLARHLPAAQLQVLQARGHCPHMSALAEVAAAIAAALREPRPDHRTPP
ncbi:MAG: alpha/beta hydrolase [Rubrivivax sp.]